MNLLVEHMDTSTPSSRKILLSWIEVIDSEWDEAKTWS